MGRGCELRGFLWAELFSLPFPRFFCPFVGVWFFCVFFSGWVLMVLGAWGCLCVDFFHVDVCGVWRSWRGGFIPDLVSISVVKSCCVVWCVLWLLVMGSPLRCQPLFHVHPFSLFYFWWWFWRSWRGGFIPDLVSISVVKSCCVVWCVLWLLVMGSPLRCQPPSP